MTVKKLILIFGIAVLVMAAAALVDMYRISKKYTWHSFKNMVLNQPKTVGKPLFFSLAFAAFFMWAFLAADSRQSGAVVSLNYVEASKGQNPNGTRFNMSEIISDEVLERAIQNGAFEHVNAEQLSKCLNVLPLVQGNSQSRDQYHISTEFYVEYNADKDTMHLDSDTVVQMVMYAYKEFCIEKYADSFEELKLTINPKERFAEMDYLDIVEYLKNKAGVIQNYMYALEEKAPGFIASNGETFSSAAEKCTDIRNMQIENNLQNYLLQNGISKNPGDYIGRLQYENMLLDFERRKAAASFDIRNRAVQLYSDEMTRIVLVPTWDETGEYYMGRTKVGIDTLSVEAESYSRQAADYLKKMEFNASVIAQLSASSFSGQNGTAEQMIENISAELEKIAAMARAVAQEYSASRMNQCISIALVGSSKVRALALCMLLSAVFFVALNTILVTRNILKGRGKTDDSALQKTGE